MRTFGCTVSKLFKFGDTHLQMAETIMGIRVNCSPMLPELFDKYPHREEDRKIDVATLFL